MRLNDPQEHRHDPAGRLAGPGGLSGFGPSGFVPSGFVL